MKLILFRAIALLGSHLLGSLAAAVPARELAPEAASDLPRLVLYYQTTHDSQGQPISMLPLVTEKNIALTHLIVCSFHINEGGSIHLNDYPPQHPLFYTLWNETQVLRNAGVRIMGMVGGAAAGSFDTDTLDGNSTDFELYYGQLRDTIAQYGLQGMDLDVEEYMSLAGITRLIWRLRDDFGPNFLITLAPVGTALTGGPNLSGFSYTALESAAGRDVSFYNAQFYNGFGNLATTADFDGVVGQGWNPTKILVGQVTTPANGGGWIPYDRLNQTIANLRNRYGQIGGIMGWEYFNSQPGGLGQPWQWAQIMTAILRPNQVPRLTITKAEAEGLVRAWKDTVVLGSVSDGVNEVVAAVMPDDVTPNVDYISMINA